MAGCKPLRPGTYHAPADVECPRPREPSAHTTSLTEPLGQSARDRNEPIVSTSVTKARNGHTLTKENRMIPRFAWAGKEC